MPQEAIGDWQIEISFLSAPTSKTYTKAPPTFLRSNNSLSKHLSETIDPKYDKVQYGGAVLNEFSATLNLNDTLGADKSVTAQIHNMQPENAKAFITAATKLAIALINPDNPLNAYEKLGKKQLETLQKLSETVFVHIDASPQLKADTAKKLAVNSLFLRGATTAVHVAAQGANDKRLTMLSGMIQSLANNAATPHAQLTGKTPAGADVLAHYVEQRDIFQKALAQSLVRQGILPNSQ